MSLDWSRGALAEGLCCYHSRLFFDAHEHWESVWLAASEPEKTFLQAIIQVAAAFHHLNQGNRAGAVSLLARAQRKLAAYPDQFRGVSLAQLRGELDGWLTALTKDRQGEPFPGYPAIL